MNSMLEKKELQKREANILPTISPLGILRSSNYAYMREAEKIKQKAPLGELRSERQSEQCWADQVGILSQPR